MWKQVQDKTYSAQWWAGGTYTFAIAGSVDHTFSISESAEYTCPHIWKYGTHTFSIYSNMEHTLSISDNIQHNYFRYVWQCGTHTFSVFGNMELIYSLYLAKWNTCIIFINIKNNPGGETTPDIYPYHLKMRYNGHWGLAVWSMHFLYLA